MRSLPLPSCPQAQQWIAYCNLELTHNLFDRVEAIFARCCRSSTSVDLWRFYLDYIRRVNPIDPANIELAKQARAIIGAAFEFALSHVGHDRRAGEIWGEYIAFLKEAPVRCLYPSSRCLQRATDLTAAIPRISADARHVGRPAEDGRAAQGVPARRAGAAQQCRDDLAGLQRVREQPEQDDGALLALTVGAAEARS